jgi:hypothetical protein
MNEKILKYLIYIAGVIGLYAFIAIRVLPVFNSMLIEKSKPEYFEFTRYGEQYYASYIRHFREELPKPVDKYRLSDRNPGLNNSGLIAFGDSFFDFSRQKTVAERLRDSLGIGVHARAGFLATKDWYPLVYLSENKYQKAQIKYLIYEVVERNIHERFIIPHELKWKEIDKGQNGLTCILKNFRDFVFNAKSEELFSILLRGSYLTSGLYSGIATLKFDLFGYISSQTPVYSLDKFGCPMLFYDLTVSDKPTGFYFNHTDELIKTYCTNLADLSEKLLDYYNLKLIFVPVPNKFTIYSRVIKPGDEYDDFLPRLYREMQNRNISYVNLYDIYNSSDTLLYYGTDSHWNKKGVDIAVNEILKELRKDVHFKELVKSK